MKYIIILGDGMADYPMERLGNKTPLQAASKPSIDRLAQMGRAGLLQTVPPDMPPGSEIANMAVLGYDVKEVYQGRGVLEAASMGVELDERDLAMRCNLICLKKGIIKNHSAGHISNEEAQELISALKIELDSDSITFHPGVSYRHLLVVKNGLNNFNCTPPHDVPGTPFRDVLVKPNNSKSVTGDLLNELILKSQAILAKHPVNLERIAAGKDPANSIWPWSPGHKPKMKTLQELYSIRGAVISAVDLIYGIGAYAGMKGIKVPGSTGLYTTNYEGKAEAALKALEEVDLVYLHIEASDEAGHEGNAELKTKTIEYLDNRVVKFLMEETAKMKEDVALALLPDHPTPCDLRTHTHDSVPFIIYHPGVAGDDVVEYNEESVKNGFYGELKGDEFMKALLRKI
ncbi:MAG: cofactor-independent phosphoglycerate mutase [Bacteroidetes bacterium]|nr:cofactor-independent phosphoglycerate mutase [Bacteroidota bacterium]